MKYKINKMSKNWFQQNGIEDFKPAVMTWRPFDPVNVSSIDPEGFYNPGVGVSHASFINIEFKSILGSEAFSLAAEQAFKRIRQNLKSNLPYTQAEYNEYLDAVIPLYVASLVCARRIEWYTEYAADMPEINDVCMGAPENYFEQGVVKVSTVNMLRDAMYPTTLNDYAKLENIMKEVNIPEKLKEYIEWWVGKVYIDQFAPNPMLYIPVLWNVTFKGLYDGINVVDNSVSWNELDGSVNTVIKAARYVMFKFGVFNADIGKTLYSPATIPSYELVTKHQPTAYHDDSFFTIIENSYCGKVPEYFGEYIRVDMRNNNDQDKTAAILGLSKWADVPAIFDIKSQSLVLSKHPTAQIRQNYASTIPNGTTVKLVGNSFDGLSLYAYQTTGEYDVVQSFSINAGGSESGTFEATPSLRFGDNLLDAVIEPGANTYVQPVDGVPFLVDYRTGQLKLINVYKDAANTFDIYLQISGSLDNPTVQFWAYGYWNGSNFSSGVPLATVPSGGYILNQSANLGDYIIEIGGPKVPVATRANLWIAAFSNYATFVANFFDRAKLTLVVDAEDSSFSVAAITDDMLIVSNIDHHIPMVRKIRYQVNASGSGEAIEVNIEDTPVLTKKALIPAMVSKQNISAALYWMYVALLQINRAKSDSGKRHGKRGGKDGKPKDDGEDSK